MPESRYVLTMLGGEEAGDVCPAQAEGVLADGRPCYFRARHGGWTPHVGLPGWPPDLLEWDGEGWLVAEGTDETQGWMPQRAIVALLDEHLPTASAGPS